MARGFKFQIYEVEEFYYLCSENKSTDQLCGYHTGDLRLCFRMYKKASFLMTQLIYEFLLDKTNVMGFPFNEDSDQPVHLPCLIGVFTVYMKKAKVLS